MVRAIAMTAAVGLALLAASAAAPVRAELNICNKTQSRVGVAIGYKEADALTTEGWWNLRPGACETVRPGPLADRYFYVHARDWEKNGTWRGSTPLCTQTKVFTIHGAGECAGRGFEEADFFEVDIGDSESWTVDLVEE